jgi:hypothetical protein
MLHWELAAHLATSKMELRLVAAGVPVEKRHRAVACPGTRYLWQSSLQRRTVWWSCCTWCHTKHSLLGYLTHVPWCCAIVWSPYLNIMPVYSTRDMRSGLVGNMMFVRKLGSLPMRSSMSRKIVLLLAVLWFQLLQNLHLVHTETQLLSENVMHSCSGSAVPVKPDELTSLDFGCTPYGHSLPFHWRCFVTLLHTLSGHSQSPETCCAMLWSSLCLVLLSDKHD